MTEEKYIDQIQTLTKFIQIYCDNNHLNSKKQKENLKLSYNDINLDEQIEFNLCDKCKDMFFYANQRLQNCKQDPKPKCRMCKNKCYEKEKLKQMAKIMRSSAIALGLSKITKIFKRQ